MADVLSSALGRRARLDAIAVERIGLGVGIVGESWRVHLHWAERLEGAPETVVVKLASRVPENRAQGVALGLYEAEVRFYRNLASDTRTRTPHCFHAEKDPSEADFVVVMEDLGALHMVDQHDGLDPEQAEAAVVALADLHAGWWGKVDGPATDWAPSLVHARIQSMAGLWPELWPVFVERFGAHLPEAGIEVGEAAARSYWAGMSRLAEAPWTLLHMDYRCENLLFESEVTGPESVVVLDWQSLGRGAAAYDLSYLLGGSLTVDARRRDERQLVTRYLARLGEQGVTGYDFDQLWLDYRVGHLVTGTSVCALTGAAMDLGNERGRQLIATMTERHFAAAADLDSVAALDG